MSNKTGKPATSVVLGPVRLSYIHIWEPNKEGKYAASLLIPKTNKELIKQVEAAIAAATEEGKLKKFAGKATTGSSFKKPMRDGDEDRPGDAAYAGMMFVNASSSSKQPGVVNKARQPITDKSDLYSGVWAYVDVNMYPFNFEGKIGIACGLNNIMKVKDDEALAGGQSAETAFAAVEIDEDDFI